MLPSVGGAYLCFRVLTSCLRKWGSFYINFRIIKINIISMIQNIMSLLILSTYLKTIPPDSPVLQSMDKINEVGTTRLSNNLLLYKLILMFQYFRQNMSKKVTHFRVLLIKLFIYNIFSMWNCILIWKHYI